MTIHIVFVNFDLSRIFFKKRTLVDRNFTFPLFSILSSTHNYAKLNSSLCIFRVLTNTKMNFTEVNNFSECGGATDEELEWFLETFSYWTEGVFQLGLGKLNLCSW